MEALVWPVEFRRQATARVLLGRFFHWALVVVALGLVAGGVISSGLLLSGHQFPGGLLPDHAANLMIIASGLGIGAFFFGRSLRYVIARE